MELPQEIEIWHVIPLIRKLLVLDLKQRGLKQKRIASLLGITESAVSQYVKEKRAKDCDLVIPADVLAEVHLSADMIAKDAEIRESGKSSGSVSGSQSQMSVVREINRLSALFKEKRIICRIHRNKDSSLKDCAVCYDK